MYAHSRNELGELTLPGGEKEVIITPKWRVGRWRGYATGANGGGEGVIYGSAEGE